ncbi:MAG: CBS domain-containing protein [Nitrososphaerales archaeon]
MKLGDLRQLSVKDLSKPIEVLEADTSIAKVVGFLRQKNLREAFIEDLERTAIVTLRSLLDVQNVTNARLSTVASHIPRLNPNNNVEDAATLMFEYRIRSLPIYENGKPSGMIETTTIIEELMNSQSSLKANRLMTPDPITLDEWDDIGKARRIMVRRKIDQIPVTKQGKLNGVVSSESIVFNTLPSSDRQMKGDVREGRSELPIHKFSSPDSIQNNVTDSLGDVFVNMKKNNATYSVITNYDEIQGIITHRDFMRILTNPKTHDGIPMYIIGLPNDPFEAESTREKFTRVVSFIKRARPDIVEARAIIKAGETKAVRKRYRVHVFIMSPRQRYSYTASGFELPDVFDEIDKWAKTLVPDKERRKIRARADPGSVSGQRPDLWAR